MHYVICYDIENDRLRGKTAKLLARNGRERMQRSVYAAAFMAPRRLGDLKTALHRLFDRHPLSPGDSVVIVPLREENVSEISIYGDNNVLTLLEEKPLKIML